MKSALPVLLLALAGIPLTPHSASAGFYRSPVHGWRGGHWVHDRHGGRLGWWWVVGPSWHFFARPYPSTPPQTVIIQQVPATPPPQVTVVQPSPPAATPAPQTPVLYYCKAKGTFYPDTMTCPGGWSISTAGAPPAP